MRLQSGEIIAIDGKTVRGTRRKGHATLHLVSAYARTAGMVLGQRKVDSKSNEITAIPELLKLIEIKDCIVTIDAMGCQKKIAQQVQAKGGDYVFAVKGNQGALYEVLKTLFSKAAEIDYEAMVYAGEETLEKEHGRLETRCYKILPVMYIQHLRLKWAGMKSVIEVTRRREIGEQRQEETHYYISSLAHTDKQLSKAIRGHWSIENNLHWSLDVSFKEDHCRARIGHAAENFSIMRRLVLNLLKAETSMKVGILAKRKMAGWDNNCLLKLLQLLKS